MQWIVETTIFLSGISLASGAPEFQALKNLPLLTGSFKTNIFHVINQLLLISLNLTNGRNEVINRFSIFL